MTQPPASEPASGHRRRRNLLWIAVLLTAAAAGGTFKYARHHFFAKRFAIVEPGRLYRSGYCEPGPLSRIIRKHRIKTILTLLNDEPGSEEQRKEEEVVRREGVRLIRIGMPGDGLADFDLLEQAADILADPPYHPVLVHCYAGSNRTGAVYAVWRMRHCGWSWRHALDECQDYGLSPRYNAKLFEHLKRYYAERVEPARPHTRPEAG